jgi:hypothetical protein
MSSGHEVLCVRGGNSGGVGCVLLEGVGIVDDMAVPVIGAAVQVGSNTIGSGTAITRTRRATMQSRRRRKDLKNFVSKVYRETEEMIELRMYVIKKTDDEEDGD